MATKKDFEKVANALTKAKVNCNLGLTVEGDIQATCGFDYPDELCEAIWDATEPLGVEVEVSADTSGYSFQAKQRINRGPQQYDRY